MKAQRKDDLFPLLIVTIILLGFALIVYYNAPSDCCSIVSKVHACVSQNSFVSCRVDLESGGRITTDQLVVAGDNYCDRRLCESAK